MVTRRFGHGLVPALVFALGCSNVACSDNTSDQFNDGVDVPRDGGLDGAIPRDATADADAAPPAIRNDGGDGGGRSDASDGAPVDPGVIGTLGQPCPKIGALGCAGHDQKGQLICGEAGRWASNGVCEGDLNCDTTAGNRAGSCQPVVAACETRSGSESWCEGTTRKQCDADRVRLASETCIACLNGDCVDCMPGARDCVSGDTARVCDSTGHWQVQTACGGTMPVCLGGNCRECNTWQTRCSDDKNQQACSSSGYWSYPTQCAYTCRGSGCAGQCNPGTTGCIYGVPSNCTATYDYTSSVVGSESWYCAGSCVSGRFGAFSSTPIANVTDSSTGLHWEMRPRTSSNWATAKATCEADGHRLPTYAELNGLRMPYYNYCTPDIDQGAFRVDSGATIYWTADLTAGPAVDGGASQVATYVDFSSHYSSGTMATTQVLAFRCVW